MTREDAINELKIFSGTTRIRLSANFYEALNTAIKALEQEPVLDKIRTEILEEAISHSGTGEEVVQAYADGLRKALQILDKYKSESEVSE